MRHTLKASFAHRSDAQHALNELLASGYQNVDMAESSTSTTVQAGWPGADGDKAHHFSGSVRRFAIKLFGSRVQNHEAKNPVASVGGRHVVELTADSEPDATRAFGIIERFGPVAMEDHEDEALSSGDGPRPVYPPGAEPGALQYRAHEDSHYFGVQRADAPPTGNTFEEAMGADSQWGDPDHGMLHVPSFSPWGDSAIRHGADAPAYRYGVEMRSSDRYRNRSWDEAEPDLKSAWERPVSGNPAWAASRSAIRRGWDEVTPEIDDDSFYRNHWTSRYANSAGDGDYDDYKPAYIYGSEARRSEKYRSRDWRDVEPHLKTDWEARHAGRLSSWEQFKDAVKHGWHGISPDMDGAAAAHPTDDPGRARRPGKG